MNPYASPKEWKIGANRPKIQHVNEMETKRRTRSEPQDEQQAVAAERRAIKKSARRHLKEEIRLDLADSA